MLENKFIIALKLLNDHGGSSTAAVADTNAADLAVLLLKHTKEGGDDPGTRAAKRVAESHSATVQVDLVLVDVEELHVGEGDNGEGLVDLVGVDLLLGHASVLESLRDGESGCGGELGGCVGSITPAENLSDGLKVVLLDVVLAGEDEGGSAVGERRGVGSSDGAVLLEDGTESLGLGLVEVAGLVVLVDNGVRLATDAGDGVRCDLLAEPAVGLGGLGLLV